MKYLLLILSIALSLQAQDFKGEVYDENFKQIKTLKTTI